MKQSELSIDHRGRTLFIPMALSTGLGKGDDEISDVLEHVLAGLYLSHGCCVCVWGGNHLFGASLFWRRFAEGSKSPRVQ
jgi:hypothetical protein